jgi:hypothetical protein
MIYTSGDWMVKPGREEEFIEAWHDLAEWTAAEICSRSARHAAARPR